MTGNPPSARQLRSKLWFDNPDNIDMTALYLERYLNFGLSLEELRSGKPIIGIAQTGSDLSPCNRHHLVLAERIREGIAVEAVGRTDAAFRDPEFGRQQGVRIRTLFAERTKELAPADFTTKIDKPRTGR